MTDTPIARRDFYVYALFREDGITPFYIGKGRGNRIDIHERNAPRFTSHKDRIIQSMLAAGVTAIPKAKLVEDLSDDEAKQIEVDLIHLIGRCPNGPLANLTRGGDGVAALSPESRAKKSSANVRSWSDAEVRRKRVNGMAAVWVEEKRAEHGMAARIRMSDPALRARMKCARKEAAKRPDVQARVKAAAQNEESRKKKSSAMKARWQEAEFRARRSEGNAVAQSSEAYREKRRAIGRAIWTKPGMREQIAATRSANPTVISDERRRAMIAAITSPESLAKSHATNRKPEVREKRIAAQRAAFARPEEKARRSAASKKVWARRKAQYALPSANSAVSKP